MLRQTYRPSHKPRLTASSALVFHSDVVFLLLTLFHGGHSQAINQPQQIVAMVGDDVTLPCHVQPATDAFAEKVEWSRHDQSPLIIHVQLSGEDLPGQNPLYRGRTSVSISNLKHGDASLKLSKVNLSDEGTYKCIIQGLKTESIVQLVVNSSILSTSTIIGVIVGIIFILAVVSIVWKWRQIKLKTTKYHDVEKLKARENKSNSTSDDPEQKFLIVRETDSEKHTWEEDTTKNLDLQIKSLIEESGLTEHEQPGTVLVQKEGETEIQSVNIGTGQTEKRVMSEANEVSYPAEKEGQQDKNKDNNNEGQNTAPIQDDTKLQLLVVGQKDQLLEIQSNVDKKDEDKETAGQGLTGGESQQKDQQAGREMEDNLDQTRSENEISCQVEEKEQEDKKSRYGGVESTTPEKDETISQPPVNGQTNQPRAGKTELDEKDAKKKPKPKQNKTTDQFPTEVETERNTQQEGSETNNHLDKTGNKIKTVSCPAKKEGQQDRNKDGRDGEENHRQSKKENTKSQLPADGQTGLLPTGKGHSDTGKKNKGKKTKNQGLKDGKKQEEDKKGEVNEEGKTQSDKGPIEGGKQKDAPQAGTKTSNLDQTRGVENEASCPAEEGGLQDNKKDGKDGETTPTQDNTKPQPPVNRQTDQISAEDVKSNESKEKMEKTGLQSQTEGETHGEQPEKNQKGDGGGETATTSTKPNAAKSARSKKRRRRK